ncbi:MAG TPA: thrombospondin type 3 repeat-containing protein [Polyangiaceae bacterium]|nr:thrombospondin type 3 repeat-containing protein [Polyangiaceae bacterium]
MLRGFRAALLASVWLACSGLSQSAWAAPPPSLDLRGFNASTDPRAALYLEPAATPGHLQWNAGVWASYANRLVELEADGHTIAVPVRHQWSVDYVAGLGLTDRLAIGVVVPTVAYQTGDDVRGLLPDARALPKASLGDLSLTVKATLVPTRTLGGFALAARGRLSLPTGSAASYVSETAASGELGLLGELGLVALTVRATAGMRVRGAERAYADATLGQSLPWGAQLEFLPQALGWDDEGRWRWNLEAHGAVALTSGFAAAAVSPALMGASARYAFGDVGVIGGAELPLNDALGAPQVRAVLGFSYAPRVIDTDEDGVPDKRDECPELAEDIDQFQDADGCPDFDNDDDGVPDDQDKCPKEKEDSDEYQDDDGCLDPNNDADALPDAQDKCPNEPGPAETSGCPAKDLDLDGIDDNRDRCPKAAEDRDAFEDEDGCPDPDDDADGVPDVEDACVREPGPARSEPALHGCPSPDRDGDTLEGELDKCPEQAETFNGEADEDGCPELESKAKPLASFVRQRVGRDQTTIRLELAQPLVFDAQNALDSKSERLARSIAAELNRYPQSVVLVGVRPARPTSEAEQTALNRSFAVVELLRHYTHRDEVAETIHWKAVEKLPRPARADIGFLVLSKDTNIPEAAPVAPARRTP